MKSARDIVEEIKSGATTATAELEQSLDAIRARNDELNVFVHVDEADARACAGQVDERIARGENPGALAGVPIALKDNLCRIGVPTTAGSRILEGWKPPYSATVVDLLLAAGAVPVGTTNIDDLAMGSTTETSYYGPTRNPLDPSRVPGGSSGGSAAAVAAHMTPVSLGSDTGGSIRQPAALCGVVGVKPTYGLVSRYGLIAFASSLDQIGPFASNVTDAALVLVAIAGHDPRDSTSLPRARRRRSWRASMVVSRASESDSCASSLRARTERSSPPSNARPTSFATRGRRSSSSRFPSAVSASVRTT